MAFIIYVGILVAILITRFQVTDVMERRGQDPEAFRNIGFQLFGLFFIFFPLAYGLIK